MPQSRAPRWLKQDDLIEFLQSLPRVRVGQNYSEADRASDFIAVFSGNSDAAQGGRVLAQLAEICDPMALPADADHHGTLAFKAGARYVFQRIQRCFVIREVVKATKDEGSE